MRVTLAVRTCAGFALTAVSCVVALAGANAVRATVLHSAITISSLLSAAVGAGLAPAVATMLAAGATAVTSTTAEATAVASTTVTPATIASAIAAASVRSRASGSGNNFELRQASHRQCPLEHPLNILEQRALIGRDE
jgi:hypothetical protein